MDAEIFDVGRTKEMARKATKKDSQCLMVYKSNDLVTARFDFSVVAQKVLAALISKINPEDKSEKLPPLNFTLPQIAKLANVSRQYAYKAMDDVTTELQGPVIKIKNIRGGFEKINLFHKSIYDPEKQEVTFIFHDDIDPHIRYLAREFTKYQLVNIQRLKSKYGIRFYELLRKAFPIHSKNSSMIRTYNYEEFKSMVGCTDKFDRASDFKKHVIEKAKKEIEKVTDIRFEYWLKKINSRRVTHIDFKIFHNEKNFVFMNGRPYQVQTQGEPNQYTEEEKNILGEKGGDVESGNDFSPEVVGKEKNLESGEKNNNNGGWSVSSQSTSYGVGGYSYSMNVLRSENLWSPCQMVSPSKETELEMVGDKGCSKEESDNVEIIVEADNIEIIEKIKDEVRFYDPTKTIKFGYHGSDGEIPRHLFYKMVREKLPTNHFSDELVNILIDAYHPILLGAITTYNIRYETIEISHTGFFHKLCKDLMSAKEADDVANRKRAENLFDKKEKDPWDTSWADDYDFDIGDIEDIK